MTELHSEFNYFLAHDPHFLKAAAALVDNRDDNAHPLDHDSFFRARAIIVATNEDHEVVGCAAIKEGEGEVAEMGYLIVSPAYRRRGIAQRLTQERFAEARRQGINFLWATVRDENQASRANVLKNGYQFFGNYLSVRGTGNTIGWYFLPLEDGLDHQAIMQQLVGDRLRVED